jgi:hypothetical protein
MKHARIPANENRADLPMSVVTQAALALPPLQQLELIRLLTGEFTYSYGSDEIDRGVDMILIDLRDGSEAPARVGWSL